LPRRFWIAAGVAVVALLGAIAIGVTLLNDDNDAGGTGTLFATTTRAAAPYETFDEARVAVGDDCLRVLVASTPALRNQGLRNVRDLAPYDGMVFVFPDDVQSRFTMANTLIPLDIAWYASDGAPVDSERMEPCPDPTGKDCPLYEAEGAYRYALERPAGSGSEGSLAPCS
jgi:uncharacterized membrane protein (UPF0127 family)